MNELSAAFLQQLETLPPETIAEANFFSAAGSGRKENPNSDLLALFMGENAAVPPWLLRALLTLLQIDCEHDELDLTTLEVSREVRTEEGKYLDLLIYHQDFIIGIEHKTFSPIDNPFDSYARLLESCVDNGQAIYTCILKPDANHCRPVAQWPFIHYSQLVEAARDRMGRDQAGLPFGKWHVFYAEFLNHLYTLSGKEPIIIMNNERQRFVTENFQQLLQANALLSEFEAAMIETARLAMVELFPERTCKTRCNNWDDSKLIHLYPQGWSNETSWVTLVYYPSQSSQTMQFYAYCTLNQQDCPDLSTLHQYVLDNQASPLFLPAADKSDVEIKLTRNGKELTISFGTAKGTLEEALQLLKEMARFVESVLVDNTFRYDLPG